MEVVRAIQVDYLFFFAKTIQTNSAMAGFRHAIITQIIFYMLWGYLRLFFVITKDSFRLNWFYLYYFKKHLVSNVFISYFFYFILNSKKLLLYTLYKHCTKKKRAIYFAKSSSVIPLTFLNLNSGTLFGYFNIKLDNKDLLNSRFVLLAYVFGKYGY